MKKNLPASVRQRLLNLSRMQAEDFNRIVTRYAIERLLYRLGQSKYADRFVLKGASLFLIWTGQIHRPTRDIDLLGIGDASLATLKARFQEICALNVTPDGIRFEATGIKITEIREMQAYPGWRVFIPALLDGINIRLQIDVGFGDAVSQSLPITPYPTLLDFPVPVVKTYPKETAIAEKLETMVTLGILNSRLKDFYDMWFLCRTVSFEGERLVSAIRATFHRRGTPLSQETPVALTSQFGANEEKMKQWRAFLTRNGLVVSRSFPEIIGELSRFALPLLQAAEKEAAFPKTWLYERGWYA